MQLSKHDLTQLDDAALTPDQLQALSFNLLSDLKLAHERLEQNPHNSSRPPGGLAQWERVGKHAGNASEPPADDNERPPRRVMRTRGQVARQPRMRQLRRRHRRRRRSLCRQARAKAIRRDAARRNHEPAVMVASNALQSTISSNITPALRALRGQTASGDGHSRCVRAHLVQNVRESDRSRWVGRQARLFSVVPLAGALIGA